MSDYENQVQAIVVHGNSFKFDAGMDVRARTAAFFKAEGESLAQAINWLIPLGDSVVLNKDGSLLACFDFAGLDIDSSSADQVNLARMQVMAAIGALQEANVVMTWQVRRRQTFDYPQGQFPEPVSARIDALQKQAFYSNPQFINRHSISLLMHPPEATSRLLSRLQRAHEQSKGSGHSLLALLRDLKDGLLGNDAFPFRGEDEIAVALEQFQKVVAQLLANTSVLGVVTLSGDALGGFLTRASSLNYKRDAHPLPVQGWYMDTFMARDHVDNSFRDVLRFHQGSDEVWASCVSLSLGGCDTVAVDMQDKLMAAPFEFTLSHVFEFHPRGKGANAVEEIERYNANRRYPIKAYIAAGMNNGSFDGVPVNAVYDAAASEAKTLREMVQSSQEGVGRYYGTVMVQAGKLAELTQATNACVEILSAARFSPRKETLHKFSSFCATVPGSHSDVALWQLITTENFADLCPLRTISAGLKTNTYLSKQLGQPCDALLVLPTKHRTPFYHTGYVEDLGHCLILGPSGTGKTTIACLEWSAFRKYPYAQVFVFDKDYSARPAIMLQGGSYVDVKFGSDAVSNTAKLAPIRAALEGDDDCSGLQFAIEWLELLVAQRGYKVSASDRTALERAVISTRSSGRANPAQLSISTVVANLDFGTAMAQELFPWTQGQINGAIFDNEEDGLSLDSLTGIEMGTILENTSIAVPFMNYAFYRIAKHLRKKSVHVNGAISPTYIYLPEVWFFLSNPIFEAKLKDWLKTFRKLGARVVMDTQSPDELVQSASFGAFRDGVATTLFTPNIKAATASLAAIYTKNFGLNEYELVAIAQGTPKKDYLISQAGLTRNISLSLDQETMAYLRSDKRAQNLLDRFLASGDPTWREAYIKELSNG